MKHALRTALFLMLLLFAAAWSLAGRPFDTTPDEPETDQAPPFDAVVRPGARDGEIMLRVLRGEAVEQMDMATYLVGVLRAEMPASFEEEALRAQVIAARTYTLHKMKNGGAPRHPDADTCDDVTCCKAYKTWEEAAAQWGMSAETYEQKLRSAVTQTDGEVILYGGEPILAVFHSSSSGTTRSAGEVWQNDLPYLQSVASPEGAQSVPNYYSVARFSSEEFKTAILKNHPEAIFPEDTADWITDMDCAADGSVRTVKVGGLTLAGTEVRSLLSLRSACFTAVAAEDSLTFYVTGYGHGVGMSQYGANTLARQGKTYREILQWYYTGVEIGEYQGG
ncbi:MAG: stage II sporulation protein D [Oscillospiraceae bacterium]|nr:stage II sporulation protein D [Oscillospiraceae bacterium]